MKMLCYIDDVVSTPPTEKNSRAGSDDETYTYINTSSLFIQEKPGSSQNMYELVNKSEVTRYEPHNNTQIIDQSAEEVYEEICGSKTQFDFPTLSKNVAYGCRKPDVNSIYY